MSWRVEEGPELIGELVFRGTDFAVTGRVGERATNGPLVDICDRFFDTFGLGDPLNEFVEGVVFCLIRVCLEDGGVQWAR